MIPDAVIARLIRAARFLRHRWYWVVGCALVLVVVTFYVHGTLNDSTERVRSRKQLVSLAMTIQAQTSQIQAQNDTIAVAEDTIASIAQTLLSVTGPDAQARQAAGTIDILKRNAIETDCRDRRASAGLAAPPDPAKPCTDQTPADVYPGGTP